MKTIIKLITHYNANDEIISRYLCADGDRVFKRKDNKAVAVKDRYNNTLYYYAIDQYAAGEYVEIILIGSDMKTTVRCDTIILE